MAKQRNQRNSDPVRQKYQLSDSEWLSTDIKLDQETIQQHLLQQRNRISEHRKQWNNETKQQDLSA